MMSQMWGKAALALVLAAGLSGCNMLNGDFSGSAARPSTREGHPVSDSPDTLPASERLAVQPLGANDLDCPSLDIADGGSAMRAGGVDSASVRYQFDISDVARTCEPQGGQFALKIGIAGELLIGPSGKPGAYATDIKIVVTANPDKKVVFSKSYRVSADTQGAAQAPFRLVPDPILLPLTRTDLDKQFNVTIGFGRSADTPVAKPHKRKRG